MDLLNKQLDDNRMDIFLDHVMDFISIFNNLADDVGEDEKPLKLIKFFEPKEIAFSLWLGLERSSEWNLIGFKIASLYCQQLGYTLSIEESIPLNKEKNATLISFIKRRRDICIENKKTGRFGNKDLHVVLSEWIVPGLQDDSYEYHKVPKEEVGRVIYHLFDGMHTAIAVYEFANHS